MLTSAGSTIIVRGDFTRRFERHQHLCSGGVFFVDFTVRTGIVGFETTNLHWPLTSEPAANRCRIE